MLYRDNLTLGLFLASSKSVPTPLLLLYPLRSGAQRAQIIEDLLDLAKGGKQAVDWRLPSRAALEAGHLITDQQS